MSEIVTLIIAFSPILVLLLMANLAEQRREREEPYQGFAVATYFLLTLLYGAAILIGLLYRRARRYCNPIQMRSRHCRGHRGSRRRPAI